MRKIIFLTLLVLTSTAFAKLNFIPPQHIGEWVLSNEFSQLNFITTKNSSKTEIQTFKQLQGHVANNHVVLNVDLSSVNTGIDIRDDRLRTLFFNLTKFPTATVTIDLKKSDLKLMKQGERKILVLDADIDFQDITQTVAVEVQVIVLAKNQRLVISNSPIIIDLKNFNLLQGVNKLREIAKLQSINTAIPVTFSLLFSKP